MVFSFGAAQFLCQIERGRRRPGWRTDKSSTGLKHKSSYGVKISGGEMSGMPLAGMLRARQNAEAGNGTYDHITESRFRKRQDEHDRDHWGNRPRTAPRRLHRRAAD